MFMLGLSGHACYLLAVAMALQELLEELGDRDGTIESLTEALDKSNGIIREANNRAYDVQRRLDDCRYEMSDMVTKAQVQEMERLFLDTVNRLSGRVQQLESSRGSTRERERERERERGPPGAQEAADMGMGMGMGMGGLGGLGIGGVSFGGANPPGNPPRVGGTNGKGGASGRAPGGTVRMDPGGRVRPTGGMKGSQLNR
jgi:hypothetical protein